MESIAKAVKQYCEKKNYNLEQLEGGVFRLAFRGDSGVFDSIITIEENPGAISVHTFSPVLIPVDKKDKVMELTTRINTKTRYGFFVFCLETLHVEYNTTIFVGDTVVADDMIRHLFHLNWLYMDIFSPAINAVVFENISPLSAIASIKRKNNQKKEGTLNESKTVVEV